LTFIQKELTITVNSGYIKHSRDHQASLLYPAVYYIQRRKIPILSLLKPTIIFLHHVDFEPKTFFSATRPQRITNGLILSKYVSNVQINIYVGPYTYNKATVWRQTAAAKHGFILLIGNMNGNFTILYPCYLFLFAHVYCELRSSRQ